MDCCRCIKLDNMTSSESLIAFCCSLLDEEMNSWDPLGETSDGRLEEVEGTVLDSGGI